MEWGWVKGELISYSTTSLRLRSTNFTAQVNEGGKGPKNNCGLFMVMWLPNDTLYACVVCIYMRVFYMFYMCVCGGCMKLVCWHFFHSSFLSNPPFRKSEIRNPNLHSVEDECSKSLNVLFIFFSLTCLKMGWKIFHCQIVGERRKIARVGENAAHETSRACSRHLQDGPGGKLDAEFCLERFAKCRQDSDPFCVENQLLLRRHGQNDGPKQATSR